MKTTVYVPPFLVPPPRPVRSLVDIAQDEACELADLSLGLCFEDWRRLYGQRLCGQVEQPYGRASSIDW